MDNTKTYQFGNVTVIVENPDISDAESERRAKHALDVVEACMKKRLKRKGLI